MAQTSSTPASQGKDHQEQQQQQQQQDAKAAEFAKARATRPTICGPHAPERPYPIYLRGIVERGFGRGGKDLGCPTANLPSSVLGPKSKLTETGIYFGYASVLPQDPDDPTIAKPGEAAEEPGKRLDEKDDDEDDDDDDDDGDEGEDGAREKDSAKTQTIQAVQNGNGSSTQASAGDRSDHGSSPAVEASDARHATGNGTAARSTDSDAADNPLKHARDASSAASSLAGSRPGTISRRGGRAKKRARVELAPDDAGVFPMVMSVGWNPFYGNNKKTAEVHIMHKFHGDFYGLEVRVVVLGYIRQEYNYVSREALIDDIETDKKVAHNSLDRALYREYASDPFLSARS